MKTYSGTRTIDGLDVRVNDQPLSDHADIHKFTGNGFEWTYEGPGPKQLAFAILMDHINDKTKALQLADGFMTEIVANFANEWTLTSDDVEKAINALV